MELIDPLVSEVDTLNAVIIERRRQDDLWGIQNHPDGTGPNVNWTKLLPDRADLVSTYTRRLCDEKFKAGYGTWLDILLEEIAETFAEVDPEKLKKELIQVAAVAIQWVSSIDRRLNNEL